MSLCDSSGRKHRLGHPSSSRGKDREMTESTRQKLFSLKYSLFFSLSAARRGLLPLSLFLPQAAATEGKCWKTRIEIVIREYHKWRTYFKKRVLYFRKLPRQREYSAFPVCVLFV